MLDQTLIVYNQVHSVCPSVNSSDTCLFSCQVYIVTEYLARGSLFEVLHRDSGKVPISLSQRLLYALGVARGMGYLHLQGIAHRDLKTGNILVGLDNTVKVSACGAVILFGPEFVL